MLRSLVGSEMCIRDRGKRRLEWLVKKLGGRAGSLRAEQRIRKARALMRRNEAEELAASMANWLGREMANVRESRENRSCLLYTSDAADEEDSVDLGGSRINKKKKNSKRRRSRSGEQN
eukprot:TRINITY_DN54024_c0_g1_i1.p1 TRINITY_DN54024_c0_g1~~TRINITY_DN54024_c0_g1_i1.p1  ORF type:complete len:119 (+),score=43.69 TRINITY_DN54024_c0_g1_i1:170-526(+)